MLSILEPPLQLWEFELRAGIHQERCRQSSHHSNVVQVSELSIERLPSLVVEACPLDYLWDRVHGSKEMGIYLWCGPEAKLDKASTGVSAGVEEIRNHHLVQKHPKAKPTSNASMSNHSRYIATHSQSILTQNGTRKRESSFNHSKLNHQIPSDLFLLSWFHK